MMSERPRETSWGILAAIAGVAGVFVATIAIVVQLQPSNPEPPHPNDGTLTSTTVTSAPTSTTNPELSRSAISGQIINPSDNEHVPMVITVSGTATGVPPAHRLWLFVEFLPDGPLFPGAITQAGDQWVADELYVGGPGQAGQSFILHLTDLDPTGLERLNVYFERERKLDGNPVGLTRTELEKMDVKFLAEVAVNRMP